MSESAERALIGATLLDQACYHEAALPYSMFSNARCEVAWKAIGKCISNNIEVDPITVADASRNERDGEYRINASELTAFCVEVRTPNIQNWAKSIREDYIRTGVKLLTSEVSHWEQQGYTPQEQLAAIRKQLEKLENTHGTDLPTLGTLAAAEATRIRNSTCEVVQGLPDGIGLSRVVPGGISRGRVSTVFAESGNFKTTLKNNIVLGIAKAGFRVLDCSFEDQNKLTAHRLIARCTGLNYGAVAAGTLDKAQKSRLELSSEQTKIADNVRLGADVLPNVDEIIRTARYYKAKEGLDAVAIDYVQLLESRNPRQTQKELLDEVMRKLQLAARRDNIAYIVVSQVKQDVNTRTDHRPQITDMIGSSAMRTASKLMIGAYKPSFYHTVPGKNSGYENLYNNHPNGHEVYENMLELHILKNVLGKPRVVVHCSVNPGTGVIKPFDMRDYA